MSQTSRTCTQCGADAPEASRFCSGCGRELFALQPGEILDEKYEILDKLAEGGMGEVYRARHIHLDEIRIIKVMKAAALDEAGRERRFIEEARLATRIRHPNIATLYDFARLQSGVYYMVWEFIDGRTLLQFLRRRVRLPPDVSIEIALQVLSGLAELHRAGVVHRDISPDNIMIIDRNGRRHAKIIDLGIAKRISQDYAGMTATGMFMGKLKYCSPEQAGLLAAGETIDVRSDLYSFGAVLYEMLSGSPVFDSSTPEGYLAKHIKEPPPPLDVSNLPPEIGEPLAAIVAKALRKDRKTRFSSAEQFASALADIHGDTSTMPTVARPSTTRGENKHPTTEVTEQAPATRRGGRAAQITIGASIAVGALAIGYAIWKGRPVPASATPSHRVVVSPPVPPPTPTAVVEPHVMEEPKRLVVPKSAPPPTPAPILDESAAIDRFEKLRRAARDGVPRDVAAAVDFVVDYTTIHPDTPFTRVLKNDMPARLRAEAFNQESLRHDWKARKLLEVYTQLPFAPKDPEVDRRLEALRLRTNMASGETSGARRESSAGMLDHQAVVFARPFEPIAIEARWPGAPPDLTGTIFFHHGRFGPWMRAPLEFSGERVFGKIPGPGVRPSVLAYYLEAADSAGNLRRFGSDRDPIYVRVGRR